MPKKNVIVKDETPAPFLRRLFAYLVDASIISLIILLPLSPKITLTEDLQMTELLVTAELFSAKTILFGFLAALLTILYWALLEYKLRQSIGKMIMRIHVKSTDTKRLTFGQCFLRNIPKFSSLILFIDTLVLLFGGTHQRFFDKLAHTTVTRTPPKNP